MQFSLSTEAANAPDPLLQRLDELIRRVADGVHDLTFDDIGTIEDSPWFRSARRSVQELVRQLSVAEVWGATAPRVRIQRPEEIAPACDAALNPLVIVVENDASDGALVEAAMLAFGSPRAKAIWNSGEVATPRGWRFENGGGGGEIPRKVQEFGSPPRPGGPRVIVVCDSDRTMPSDSPSPSIDRYRRATQAVGAPPPLVLPVREVENYLPDAFWRAWLEEDRGRASYREPFEALATLTDDQRDFIDMKGDTRLSSGPLGPLFDGSDPENPQPEARHAAALRGNRKNLKGSGTDEAGNSRMTIRRLPAFVKSGKVGPQDLRGRDRVGKLLELVTLIEQEL